MLLGAVSFLMLLACVNAGSILLNKALQRLPELALRRALGAGTLRLGRLLLTESMVLGVITGVLGLLLAHVFVSVFLASSSTLFAQGRTITFNYRVFMFAASAGLISGAIAGIVPILWLKSSRLSVSTRNTTIAPVVAGPCRISLEKLLVAGEIALTTVLLIGTALMSRSYGQLLRVQPGFNSEGVLVADLMLPELKYTTEQKRALLLRQLLDRLRHVPGTQSAALVSHLPLAGRPSMIFSVAVPYHSRDATGCRLRALYRVVSPGYFRALGIPIVRGRDLADGDQDFSLIVNARLAQKLYACLNSDVLGAHVRYAGRSQREIVGVVGDVLESGLETGAPDVVYLPYSVASLSTMTLVVKTAGDPGVLAAAVLAETKAVAPDVPLYNVRTMDEVLNASSASRWFRAVVLGAFGLIALVLALFGTFGTVSSDVARRSTDLAIRAAVGASPTRLLRSIVSEALSWCGTGLAAGVVLSVALSRLLRGFLFGVSSLDAHAFCLAIAVIGLTTITSAVLAGHRVLRLDPAERLRA